MRDGPLAADSDSGIKALRQAPEELNVLNVGFSGLFPSGHALSVPSGCQVPAQPPPVVILNLNCALRFAVLFAVHTAFGAACLTASEADSVERVRFFEARIRPILVERCEGCHSAEAQQKGKLKEGLFADSRKGLLEGGDSGPALVETAEPNRTAAAITGITLAATPSSPLEGMTATLMATKRS